MTGDDSADVAREPTAAGEVVTCPAADVPTTGCVAVGDGRVLLARVDDQVVAYENACLHKGTRLERGVVRAGTITCPAHLWRYRLADGACLNAAGGLLRLASEVVDGQVRVVLPPPPSGTIRDRLLTHAKSWERDA